eukprot:m.44840 g.44840  ORF g.44840 m.44840 type:complete len:80 (-) comp8575_c0_seq1:4910-5149(-)
MVGVVLFPSFIEVPEYTHDSNSDWILHHINSLLIVGTVRHGLQAALFEELHDIRPDSFVEILATVVNLASGQPAYLLIS